MGNIMFVRVLLFVFIFLSGFVSKSQSLFNINTIRTIEINFYDSNWDHLLDSLATLTTGTGAGTQRILAEVIIDGTVFDSCGVRYKGNSSLDTASTKNPFNIDLNYTISGQEFMGKDKIKLANCFTDPSMVREALMYEISNQYMDCPHADFVRVIVNNDNLGIYTNTESVDNEFLEEYYNSSDNAFFKCDPISFELYGDNSNLAYHPDTIAYDTLYDMKSTYGLTELQTLCNNLENNITNIEQFLDVDRALWFLALSSVFVHNDGYTAFGHNYYVYKMDNGRWSIILWDVNMSFGGLLWNGTNFLPLSMSDLINQDPFLHETAFNFRPLIARLLSVPRYKKMYTAHYKTIVEENINNGYYLQRAEFMHNLIEADVQTEQYNAYSFADFNDNLYTNVGIWFNLRPGLEALMEARETYLNSLPELQFSTPDISNITSVPVTPQPFTTVTINAEVANEDEVILGYRYNQFDVFTKVQMYDDGLHNDGSAADGIYGVQIGINGTEMQYYIYAENADAGRFSPERAQYEFYTLSPEKGVVINEISADNSTIATDQNGEFDDWIELYNNSNTAVDLSQYHLSDDGNNLAKWTFPAGTMIQPGAYMIIWADKDTLQQGLHTNFKLSASGESLFLIDNIDQLVDYVDFPAQTTDITYGRFVNGTGNFTFLYPSINNENTTIVGMEVVSEPEFKYYPNPATDAVIISFSSDKVKYDINLYDLSGRLVLTDQIENSAEKILDVSGLNAGIYIIQINNNTSKLIIE